ncbi:MAG: hypothetical protein P4L40_25105 [Terracidiphilus sp.]|nr:hypothetical protein [Terracidiphilus sp.]
MCSSFLSLPPCAPDDDGLGSSESEEEEEGKEKEKGPDCGPPIASWAPIVDLVSLAAARLPAPPAPPASVDVHASGLSKDRAALIVGRECEVLLDVLLGSLAGVPWNNGRYSRFSEREASTVFAALEEISDKGLLPLPPSLLPAVRSEHDRLAPVMSAVGRRLKTTRDVLADVGVFDGMEAPEMSPAELASHRRRGKRPALSDTETE